MDTENKDGLYQDGIPDDNQNQQYNDIVDLENAETQEDLTEE